MPIMTIIIKSTVKFELRESEREIKGEKERDLPQHFESAKSPG